MSTVGCRELPVGELDLAVNEAGYTAALRVGMQWGRLELVAELMPVGAAIADLKLWRDPTFAEVCRRRTTYRRPARSAERILTEAAAAWGLSGGAQ